MKTKFLCCNIILVLVLLVAGNVMADAVYFDGFEDDALGSIPSGWTHVQGWGGNGAVVDTPVKTGIHAFRIDDTASGYASGFKTSDFVAQTSGKVDVSFDIYLTAINQGVEVLVTDVSGVYGAIFFTNEGKIKYSTGTAWQSDWMTGGAGYTADQWINVKLSFDIDSDTYSIYLNDSAVVTDKSVYTSSGANSIAGLVFEVDSPSTTSFYIDNVAVNTIPEPVTVGLLAVGSLAVLCKRKLMRK